MNKLSTYLKKYWYVYTFAVICLVASSALGLVTPQITQRIIDDVVVGGKLDLLNHLLLLMMILSVLKCIFEYLKEFIFDFVSIRISTDIRKSLFTHIQGLSVNFFDKTNTGEIMSRLKDDVNSIWEALSFIGMLLIQVVVHMTIIFYFMFRLNMKLTLIPLVVMLIAAFIAILMEKKLDTIYEDISEENAKLTTVAQENIAGVRTVKAFARERHEIKKFLSHNQKYYDLNMKQSKLFIKYDPVFMFFSKAMPLSVIIFGGLEVLKGSMSLGALTAYVEYSYEIVWPMEMVGWLINSFSSSLAANKKINKIYQETTMIKDSENPVLLPKVEGHITFDNVGLTLGDSTVLQNISFDLPAGKTVGIMGATGTGKTSIINLLQRFYDATEGEIRIDGVNIKDLSLEQLRGSISTVMQDVFLFSDTINENIKLGQKDQLDDTQIQSAAHLAQAGDFIERMESQYETVIGERGIGLSGGQKQRISIARAFAKKAPILVLDDSTSALDMETEYQIQQALNELTDVTKIIIAHRISAVRSADEILVLDHGHILERGTHDSLMKQHGYYYDTFVAQYGEQFITPKTANHKKSSNVMNFSLT